jgi:hypothetical protein
MKATRCPLRKDAGRLHETKTRIRKGMANRPLAKNSRVRDCADELRCFVRFGDYALDMLPRVAHNIFTHFKVPQHQRVDAMIMAKVPVDVMTRINNRLPIALISEPDVRRRAKPGSSSRRVHTERRLGSKVDKRSPFPVDA